MGTELSIPDSEDSEPVIPDEADHFTDVRGELCDISEDEIEEEDDDDDDEDDDDEDEDDEKEDCPTIGWDSVSTFAESGGEIRPV